MTRTHHLKQFYESLNLLEELVGNARILSECNGRMKWPRRGVYFFVEPGEHRTESGDGLRVVRVGTHALTRKSRTNLWTRLSQHRGSHRSRGGNHRGSVFRRHVGTALISRDGFECPSWGHGRSASREVRNRERTLEKEVSTVIGKMLFLWISVDDQPGPDSMRGYLERNSIALLSNYLRDPVDPPSPSWLGRHCSNEQVRASGQWNANHVNDNYNPSFLDTLSDVIQQMRKS